jgi:hypothetical protein
MCAHMYAQGDQSSCVLKQVNKDPVPKSSCFYLPVKVPGGIGSSGRFLPAAFFPLFIFLETVHSQCRVPLSSLPLSSPY